MSARPGAPAHDAFTRLLNRLEPDAGALWGEVRPLLPAGGVLAFDDTVLDKPFARHTGLVGRFWSGRHRRVVQGITLATALWTDGDALWPCDMTTGWWTGPPARARRMTSSGTCSARPRPGA
jgi:hypothetical protein